MALQHTAATKEELAALLGLSAKRLWKIERRNPANPPPELNGAGLYVVEEWQEWLEDVETDTGDADKELLELRKQYEMERIRGAKFKNDLAAGKYVKRERLVKFGKKIVTMFRGYIDDLDAKASIIFGDSPERLEQLRAISADVEIAIEDSFKREAESGGDEDAE